ncbi:hypothetical protein D4764_01G0003130 [Takifugu flavidus]|uniref:Uncharacterized protein n=1 Tax=Takifugu flavidus TaxID=433684 RepID=A0A5C6PP28_9TELE|nr:hypothetical protein D4764_01G0003130 [Takifugu flavidus]
MKNVNLRSRTLISKGLDHSHRFLCPSVRGACRVVRGGGRCASDMLYDFKMNSVIVFLSFSDSETTDDEGENQYETKDDIGDDEDQTVHTDFASTPLFQEPLRDVFKRISSTSPPSSFPETRQTSLHLTDAKSVWFDYTCQFTEESCSAN